MRTILAIIAAASVLAAPALAQTPAAASADWRTPDPENVLVIDTTKGRIYVELSPIAADAHAARLKELGRRKFYDGLKFFRVIDDFMAQTGDPGNTGEGDSDLPNLPAQFSFVRTPQTPFTPVSRAGSAVYGFIGSLSVRTQPDELMALMSQPRVQANGQFCKGVVGMARSQDPHSGNSQFFLMRAAFPDLNGKYTAFGRVIAGQDVVMKIRVGEPVPEPMDQMNRVRVLADIPAAERPTITVQNTAGPAFKAYADSVKAAKGTAFDICDLEIRAEVR
jgi:peptidylprolyl isomerase